MELFQRQQFDVLLREAAGNFAERVVHHAGGPQQALELLRSDPDGAVLRRADFVAAFFVENLLDNTSGYCFVLEALERRSLPPDPGGPASEVVRRLALAAFGDVLSGLTAQVVQQQQIYS